MSNKQDPFKNNIIFLPDWRYTDKEGKKNPYYENLLGSRVPREKVPDTIKRVNNEQERILGDNGVWVQESEHKFHRKLVAYYRPTQIDYVSRMQILEIMRFLRYYVEHGYSRLFDEFVVLYRFPETDLVKEFERNSYDAIGTDFRTLSSIYANPIHFSNGTPDYIGGTLPILGTTPHERWRGKGEHIHLPIKYTTVEKTAGRSSVPTQQETVKNKANMDAKRLAGVLKVVLGTIQEVETTMIDKKLN